MEAKKVHIKSFGCQMNKLDTALVGSALKKAGFGLADGVKDAEVVLINTCSVREHAEQRVLSHLGHLKHVKESRPELVVGVMGCMAQRLGSELLGQEAVDIVCGPGQIAKIVGLVKEAVEGKKRVVAVAEKIREVSAEEELLEEFECVNDSDDKEIRGQAFVRVMRGCDNFCSYCVVPYVRGREVSRRSESIVEQVRRLAGAGVKQVTLLGQRVNAYKYESCGRTYCLADLLGMVSEVEGIERVRFVTSYPAEEFYDEILGAMAGLKKVCKYLHMPAQSGSEKILAAMNRKYSPGKYLEMVERAKEKVAGIEISGDFIVGFPGESEEDFEATVSLVEAVRYKNCFIFKYSVRPGTRAKKNLQDTVSKEVKRERNARLLAVQERISGELSGRFVGEEAEVLVEGPSKKAKVRPCLESGYVQLVGRTGGDWIVIFDGPEELAGEIVKVKITRTSPLTLFGTLA